MSHIRRIILAVALTTTIVLALVGAGSARAAKQTAHASELEGHWVVGLLVRCERNAQNTSVCSALLGSLESFLNPLYATSDEAGHTSIQASFAATEHTPGAKKLCSPAIFSQPFTGTCRETERDTGVIKQGVTGLPDFWITDETATFYSQPPVTVHDPLGASAYPLDTAIPAVPGPYDSAHYLKLLGFNSVPPGVLVQLVVSKVTDQD
jgi:hypothetical protein